jgi:arginase
MSKIQLFENSSEIGAGTRGSSMGIEALKIAAYNSNSEFFKKFKSKQILNQNELLNKTIQFPKAKRIEGIIEVCNDLSKKVSNSIKKHQFPFILSGDHSSAIGTIAGIKSANPSLRLGVIWIDAHADLHSPFTTPTGNVHGMSLMASLNQDNAQRRVHELDHLTNQQWDKLKHLENIYPKIHVDDIVILGLRSSEDPEDYFVIENKINKVSVEHVRRNGSETVAKEVLDYLGGCDLLYISFDVDSLDCDLVSYGTGTPVPNGFTENEAAGLINNFLIDKRTCCFELVEINPCLDNKQNKMAETALRVIEHASSIVDKRG